MTYFDGEAGGDLRTAFESLVDEWPDVDATTMFGCPSYRADGTLFAVLVTEGVVLTRLPPDQRAQLAAAFEAEPFQAGDRTVTSWVQVPVDDATLGPLVPYVEASYETARAEGEP
ncbi:TfoX/Sxy family protein [Halomicroarcula sp. GCM10025324]|uniref:TfoX/Sxy family protein n=1 Tax=Haloarcula TaxID=2237 RepID=UPI0023E7B2C5|nr:TfoX/Sxy family protein [Halomicroarcula sp. ZS-22-S1]